MTSYPPIADYALIGDAHSAALVSRDGSIDWCCFHRFDARPVFARLLDRGRGGHFHIAPMEPYTATRRYLPGTNVLETRFTTAAGAVTVVDCFAVTDDSGDPAAERPHPHHQLLRFIRGERGTVRIVVDFSPRFDYGRTVPRIEMPEAGVALVYGGADALVYQSAVHVIQEGLADCRSEMAVRAGEETFVAATYAAPHELRAARLSLDDARAAVDRTRRFWERWAARCTYDGPYREAVLRSALVLKALTNEPTGAIVAAPTTSLPEAIGGVRNWDYRFTWLRDAALSLYALFILGYVDEAHAFMTWLKRTTAGRADELQAVYGVGGERFLPEVEMAWLEGYRGSRPVRVGNAAADQFQLDVYGYLLDTAWLYHRHGGEVEGAFWDLIRGAVDAVARQWMEPDRGIWEVRGATRHFVSSKVMCWVAVDRAIRLARARGLPADLERWQALRRTIRRRVEAEGVAPDSGAFVQAFGARALDASNLLIPLVRFLPPEDPRIVATVRRTERELAVDGLVYRYADGDGLPGGEGAFLICTWWLVDNLALIGDVPRARELFERTLGFANDVGLLAEQVDPATGALLGNFPQAFSHIGLIGAAMNLWKAGAGAHRGRGPRRPLEGPG